MYCVIFWQSNVNNTYGINLSSLIVYFVQEKQKQTNKQNNNSHRSHSHRNSEKSIKPLIMEYESHVVHAQCGNFIFETKKCVYTSTNFFWPCVSLLSRYSSITVFRKLIIKVYHIETHFVTICSIPHSAYANVI